MEENENNKSFNKGNIFFDNDESAQKAFDDLNGKNIPGFESNSPKLIIELFMKKVEGHLKDKEEELSSLTYFTNINSPENSQIFPNKFSTIYPQQIIPIPNFSYNQFNQFSQFNQFNQFDLFNQMNQFNQFNQFNQYNQYNQLLNYENNGFNYQNLNNNQFMNYNNNFRYNYGFQRGRGFRGGYHRNNRNNNYNYNRQNQQKNSDNQNIRNKNDLSEYLKNKTPEEQKEYLGDILFKKIEN